MTLGQVHVLDMLLFVIFISSLLYWRVWRGGIGSRPDELGDVVAIRILVSLLLFFLLIFVVAAVVAFFNATAGNSPENSQPAPPSAYLELAFIVAWFVIPLILALRRWLRRLAKR